MGVDTVPGKPENGGMVARLSTWMMHVPVDVPAKGGLTVALAARPLGSNMTDNVPVPAGLPATLHAATSGNSAVTAFRATTGSKRSVGFGVFAPVAPFAKADAKSPAGPPAGGEPGNAPPVASGAGASLVAAGVLVGAASAGGVAVGGGCVGITVGIGGGAGF